MHRCPRSQSREVSQATWHLRNAQTKGELQSVLMRHASEMPTRGGGSSLEQAPNATRRKDAAQQPRREFDTLRMIIGGYASRGPLRNSLGGLVLRSRRFRDRHEPGDRLVGLDP